MTNRLTVDEKGRANELRCTAPRTLALESLRAGADWKRNARVTMLIALALGGVLVLLQIAHTLSLYGSASLLDWLMPRL